MKKVIWIIVGVVALVIVLVLLKSAGVLGKDEGIKVSAEKAARRNITEIVTASGKIYPEKEVRSALTYPGKWSISK